MKTHAEKDQINKNQAVAMCMSSNESGTKFEFS